MPNRDATRLAVGIYAQGSERKDFRIVDSTTGAQIGPMITGLDSFGWARDERYAFIYAAHRRVRREPGADALPTGTGSAASAATTC